MSETVTLPVVSREEFRRRLAGFADRGRQIQQIEQTAFRQIAEDFVVSLCLVFGDSLDRKTLWSRIDSGLQAACASVDDGDTDRWLDLLLDHVKADAARVVRLGLLRNVRTSLASKDETHRREFLRWVESRRYAVLTHGRAAWDRWKEANKHAPQQEEDGE